jgi:5-formyltetrahydrofolate cyclo-ligase
MQPEKDAVSREIIDRVRQLPEYLAARTVAIYVDVRDEVRTRSAIPDIIAEKSCLAAPWCEEDGLRLCRIESLGELSPGRFGILEPREGIRTLNSRMVDVGECEFVIVPGVAFDETGGRLGHGLGFYDRLLSSAGNATCLCGIAFDCQIAPSIPMAAHDVKMNIVVTESRILRPA